MKARLSSGTGSSLIALVTVVSLVALAWVVIGAQEGPSSPTVDEFSTVRGELTHAPIAEANWPSSALYFESSWSYGEPDAADIGLQKVSGSGWDEWRVTEPEFFTEELTQGAEGAGYESCLSLREGTLAFYTDSECTVTESIVDRGVEFAGVSDQIRPFAGLDPATAEFTPPQDDFGNLYLGPFEQLELVQLKTTTERECTQFDVGCEDLASEVITAVIDTQSLLPLAVNVHVNGRLVRTLRLVEPPAVP